MLSVCRDKLKCPVGREAVASHRSTLGLKSTLIPTVFLGCGVKIGELAKRSGLTASRIRFYEAEGLIRVERQANGYREYPPEAGILLGLISIAQQAGFTLEQIRQLLPVGPGAWDHGALLDALKQKVDEIDTIRKRLDHTRAQLVVAIESIEDRPDGIECVDNKKRVLDRLREAGITPDLGKLDGSTTG